MSCGSAPIRPIASPFASSRMNRKEVVMVSRAVVWCAALVGCVMSFASGAMTPIAGDPVDTTSGKLAGTLLPSGVKAYLGVRYATPPTQELRWRPPQPVRWDGVWVADRKGAECI